MLHARSSLLSCLHPFLSCFRTGLFMSILSLILLWYCTSYKMNVNRLSISLFRRFTYRLQSLQSYFLSTSLRTLALSFFNAFFFGVSVVVSLFAPYCILENMIQGGEEPGKLGAGVLFFCAVHVSSAGIFVACLRMRQTSQTTMPSNSSSMDSATFLFLDLSMTCLLTWDKMGLNWFEKMSEAF